jgi:hypothetical protein
MSPLYEVVPKVECQSPGSGVNCSRTPGSIECAKDMKDTCGDGGGVLSTCRG